MERRDFIKTMGMGAFSVAAGNSLLSSCGLSGAGSSKATGPLPSFGVITGSSGRDRIRPVLDHKGRAIGAGIPAKISGTLSRIASQRHAG